MKKIVSIINNSIQISSYFLTLHLHIMFAHLTLKQLTTRPFVCQLGTPLLSFQFVMLCFPRLGTLLETFCRFFSLITGIPLSCYLHFLRICIHCKYWGILLLDQLLYMPYMCLCLYILYVNYSTFLLTVNVLLISEICAV